MSALNEDRQLLSRFRAGDRQTLEIVFTYYAPLLSALLARGRPTRGAAGLPTLPFEVGAVVQETFARAFTEEARGAYDGVSDYLQQLAAIARDGLRAPLTPDVPEPQLGSPAKEDAAAEEKELQGLVAAFLAGRDANEQHVYRARFAQHLTAEDAAAVLGLTRIAVRRLEAKLRRDLFAHLRASGYLDRARPAEGSQPSPVPEGTGGRPAGAGDTVAK